MQSINPATGEELETYAEHDLEECRDIAEAAHVSWADWKGFGYRDRGERVHALAASLRQRTMEHAALISLEMGKPIQQSRAEIIKCAQACDFFADMTEELLRDEPVTTDAARSMILFEPLGVLLGIMPWNFPFWQVLRFAVPQLMAGNGCLIKHASNVPGCGLALEELFTGAGFPKDLFRVILAPGSVAEELIAHPRIMGVSLTGSTGTGRRVGSLAGLHLKKAVLELGGSDPFVVLDDADLEPCLDQAVASRMAVSGQSCIAAKRIIVTAGAAKAFVPALVERVQALSVGDPMDETTDIGPLARADLLDDLEAQVERSLDKGAKAVTGGSRLDRPGFFYAPTVLTDVSPGMPVFDEETFGPVAAVSVARNADHALELANATPYGLGASVWTRDVQRGESLARRIRAGSVFVNALTRSDVRLPFGGIKDSGHGRELSAYGLREFVNIKTMWIG